MWHRAKRHLMWFPFLLVAMTVILAVTIVVVDQNRHERLEETIEVLEVAENVESAVTDADYQSSVQMVLTPLWSVLEHGEGDVEALVAVRDALVAMKVSADARDVHIRLVAATNQLIAGLDGDPIVLADAQVRFANLVDQHLWLK